MISKTSDFRLVEQTLTLDKSVLPVCKCVHVSVHAGLCTCKCVHGHLHMLAIFSTVYMCVYLYMTYITYIYIKHISHIHMHIHFLTDLEFTGRKFQDLPPPP